MAVTISYADGTESAPLPSIAGASSVGSNISAGSGVSSGPRPVGSSLAPPASQKAGIRPISFLLDNQAGGAAPIAFADMVIRPEELTWGEPSKMTVQQTLGGAWVDSFGPGLPTINLSGHTGWRRTLASDGDGLDRFARLKDTVFDRWHALRSDNVAQGLDPAQVRLIFSDALDERVAVVAPTSFVLRRSRSRPLLAQFQISLVVLETVLMNTPMPSTFGYRGVNPLNADAREGLGLKSLTGSIATITGMIGKIKGMVTSMLLAPVQAFMGKVTALYGQVRSMIAAGTALVSSVISVAQMTAQAGINIFRTLAAVASIPAMAKAALMSVAGAFSNIFCTLRNAISKKVFVADYTNIYGASNCSSTSGGRPASSLAGENPFYKIVPTPAALPVSVSQSSYSALATIARNDPVLTPLSNNDMRQQVLQATSGLVVAA